MPISDVLTGFSKALYSNWFLYRPDRLLVDCGEGAATTLGNGGFVLEKVLLTHGHIDHIAGLPSLLWARANGMGDTQKPLQIFHPAGDPYVADMREFIEKTGSRLPFALEWHPLEAGAHIPLRASRYVETFATRHMRTLSLGFSVIETRRRLKAEWAQLSQAELRQRAQNGENSREWSQDYQTKLITFGGDGVVLEVADAWESEILLHEATLLDATDRKNQFHATLDEAIEVAAAAKVKNLVLIHVSGRYRWPEVEAAAKISATKHSAEFPIWCLWRDKLRPLVN